MAKGFKLGDHVFLAPTEQRAGNPWDEPKRRVLGAPPPTCLAGVLREATPGSAAAGTLLEGGWCGHGEPAFTVFDVVIDGHEVLEISFIDDPHDTEHEFNHPVFVARAVGATKWTPLFRRSWEERQETLEGIAFEPLTERERAMVEDEPLRCRVSIGFEYPCDAESQDGASWIEIHALPEGDGELQRIASAELA